MSPRIYAGPNKRNEKAGKTRRHLRNVLISGAPFPILANSLRINRLVDIGIIPIGPIFLAAVAWVCRVLSQVWRRKSSATGKPVNDGRTEKTEKEREDTKDQNIP